MKSKDSKERSAKRMMTILMTRKRVLEVGLKMRTQAVILIL